MESVCVAGADDAQAAEQAHGAWPGRRTAATWFGAFAVYAGLMAAFTGHADRTWAVWGFGGYALATLLLWFGKTWVLPLATAIGVGLVAPLLWLITEVPATAEVVVIGTSAKHLLKYGTPYLPPSQLSSWTSYNPYMPVMELFGLPRSAGLSGVLGDPRSWLTLLTAVLLTATFVIMSPHRFRGCAHCRRNAAKLTAIALASPVFAFPLALGVTDPPVIALLCLALAFAARAKLLRAALVLAFACSMKSTAWAAVPVLAIMAWVQYAPRISARFTTTTLAATGLFALLAAPEAMAQPAAVMQNTVDFPLGLTKHKTPAASPLPGHMLADLGTVGHTCVVVLMAMAAVTFAAWLLLRPPRTAQAAAWRLTVGYAVMFTIDPSSRFGYYMYPLALLGWLAFTTFSSERSLASPPPSLSPALVE